MADKPAASSFRIPSDLDRGTYVPRRALLIGQCLLDTWPDIVRGLHPGAEVERIQFNNLTRLPAAPSRDWSAYDMQIVSLPLRSILPEAEYMRMDVGAPDDALALLARAKQRLTLLLDEALSWHRSHGLTSLVCNLLVPQQNPLGRLIARYDARNLCFLVEELNRHIFELLSAMAGVYLLDVDGVAASIGRRFVQDDALCGYSHGSLIDNYGTQADQRRIRPPQLTIEQSFCARTGQFVEDVWLEACAIMRTVRRADPVKLVIVDLDDTLWRGVLAEESALGADAFEGWPLGVWDALAFLHKRGVILAIASKNDERNVKAIFDEFLKTRLPLESFAIRKINWTSKIDNVGAIIREANVGADATVFVDDNPAERAAVESAYPAVRTIGADPYAMKRILLWSAETQVEAITRESVDRNRTVAAGAARAADAARMTREDFLMSLDVTVTLIDGATLNPGRRERAFELLNKTNQFNTTGERWQRASFDKALHDLTIRLVCFDVEDRTVNYGLVGVVLISGSEIRQAVMSCRVFGMEVETAVLNEITRSMFDLGASKISGRMTHNDRNSPCHDWFSRGGFVRKEETWLLLEKSKNEYQTPHVKVKTISFVLPVSGVSSKSAVTEKHALDCVSACKSDPLVG